MRERHGHLPPGHADGGFAPASRGPLRGRLLRGVLLVAIVVAGLVLSLSLAPGRAPSAPPGEPTAEGPREGGVRLDGRAGEVARVPADVVAHEEGPSAPAVAGAVVRGVVRRAGMPATAQVHAVAFPDPDAIRTMGRPPDASRQRVLDPARSAVASARTGQDGRFEIRGLEPGDYTLVAVADEGLAEERRVVVAAGGQHLEVAFDFAAGEHTLRGRVLGADGSPWHGFVGLEGSKDPSEESWLGCVPTDDDGAFAFGPLPEGLYRVRLLVAELLDLRMPVTVRVPRKGELLLRPHELIGIQAVRVVGAADDVPVADAWVTVYSWAGAAFCRALARTDAAGRAGLPSVGGDRWIWAGAAGFQLGGTRQRRGEGTGEVTIALRRCASLEGRVTDSESGRPVAGVRVHADYGFGSRSPGAVTDDDGRYRIDGLEAGTAWVFAVGEGWIPDETGKPSLALLQRLQVRIPAEGALRRDLRIRRGAWIHGRVRDHHGAAVVGAVVRADLYVEPLGGETEERAGASRIGTTDGGGSFRLDGVVPGMRYLLRATAPTGAMASGIEVLAPDGAQPVQIVLPPPRWLDVTVVEGPDDQPVPDAEMWAQGVGSPARARADAAGRGRLGPLPPGPIDIHVWSPSHQEERVRWVEESRPDLVLRLERAHAIVGKVLGPDGRPALGAAVSLLVEGEDGAFYDLMSPSPLDEEGTFRLGPVTSHGLLKVRAEGVSGEQVTSDAAHPGPTPIVLRLPAP